MSYMEQLIKLQVRVLFVMIAVSIPLAWWIIAYGLYQYGDMGAFFILGVFGPVMCVAGVVATYLDVRRDSRKHKDDAE